MNHGHIKKKIVKITSKFYRFDAISSKKQIELPRNQVAVDFHQLETPQNPAVQLPKRWYGIPMFSRRSFLGLSTKKTTSPKVSANFRSSFRWMQLFVVKGDRHVTRFDGSEERRLAGGNFESQRDFETKKNKFAHNGEVKKKN